MPLSICVFCGFSPGTEDRYLRHGRDLGALIADRGHRLIYGAGAGGLMGAVAAEATARAGTVVGVVPRFLRLREQADELPCQHLVLTADLLERKRRMIDESDGFIALPGGYGTLDEILEVVSMAALGVLTAPIVLVNTGGVWDPLVTLVEDLRRRGFLQKTDMFALVDDPVAALDHIESRVADAQAAALLPVLPAGVGRPSVLPSERARNRVR